VTPPFTENKSINQNICNHDDFDNLFAAFTSH